MIKILMIIVEADSLKQKIGHPPGCGFLVPIPQSFHQFFLYRLVQCILKISHNGFFEDIGYLFIGDGQFYRFAFLIGIRFSEITGFAVLMSCSVDT